MSTPTLVSLESVSVRYAASSPPVLREVSLAIDEGDLALVVGRTGSGKSTLLGTITGSVPHFTGGSLSGRVLVGGRDTRTHRPRDLADVVGVVGQDPVAGFVTDTVEEELAYAMEQLGLPAGVMRRRVEETLDLLGIADLRGAALHELSGGQQQRVAIGSVLTAHPQVIVLDEPTSALDPTAAEDVLATLTRLAHDLAVTVVVAEHRIERVLAYADTVIHVGVDGLVHQGAPAEVMATSDVAPPVVDLGRREGWQPLPLSIRAARRAATDLRERLAACIPPADRSAPASDSTAAGAAAGRGSTTGMAAPVTAHDLVVRHGPVTALAGVTFAPAPGEVTVLLGRNGAGKSTLLWCLQGATTPTRGTVTWGPEERVLATVPAAERRRLVSLVPQSAADLLYLDSVRAETDQGDREQGSRPGTALAVLEALAPGIDPDRHPRDLSEGQRLALVLAVQLGPQRLVLLDEPTRGLDYDGKAALARHLCNHVHATGAGVVIATHDVEFAATTADRVVILAGGEIVADGPAREMLTSSPALAPQTAKVTAPEPWLTVAEVAAALDGAT